MNKIFILYKQNKRLVDNTVIQIIGKIIAVFISFLSVFLLTRYLGVEGYGDFTLIFVYLSFFTVLSDFGLNISMVKELTVSKKRNKNTIGTYFFLRFILVIISSIIALISLYFIPYINSLKFAIFIALIGVNIGSTSGFGNALFQSELKIELITLTDLIGKVVTVVCVVLCIIFKLNFYFIVLTVFFGNLSSLMLSIYYLKKQNKLLFCLDSKIAIALIRSSLPIGITSLFSLLYFKIDTFLLSIFRNTSEIAYYGVAYKIFENILVLWGFYMVSAYPILSTKVNNIVEFNQFIKRNLKAAIYSAFLIIFFMFIISPYIIKYIAGENFIASIMALRILLFALPLFFINNLIYHIFIIKNRAWVLTIIFFTSLMFNIILNFYTIPLYGFIGASVTTLVTEFFVLLMYLFFIRVSHYESK